MILKPELLLPAGSPEALRIAVTYGADAVYIGGEAYGLRAAAGNFSPSQMAEGISFAHEHGCRVYVTANILAHNSDVQEAGSFFETLKILRPDAILISDPGMFRTARRICPEIDIHISTQANNVNYETFLFWYDLGVRRLVCGRELSLAEISEIRARVPDDMEIEVFVHGAMCISYSGRCLLSNYMTGRDANRGSCTHPCRWTYSVVEESRPGEAFPVFENERGTFLFSSKDLCMIDHIPDLVHAGIDSFKIEGRMKSPLYIAAAARAYRQAIDDWYSDPALYASRLDSYRSSVSECVHREYFTGFFYGKPDQAGQLYDQDAYEQPYVYLGFAEEMTPDGRIRLTQKNKFCIGDLIEILEHGTENRTARVVQISDETGRQMESAPHARQILYIRLADPADGQTIPVPLYTVLRKAVSSPIRKGSMI